MKKLFFPSIFFLAGSFYFIISLIVAFSCGKPKINKTTTDPANDSIENFIAQTEQKRLENRRRIEIREKSDSINLGRVLHEALLIAEKSKDKAHFYKRYTERMPDSSYQVEVEINSDFHFTKEFPHLIIKRSYPGYFYFDIYIKEQGEFQNILSHQQWAMEYTGDTIQDINGDGLKDFVVNWYGVSGCCYKSFSNVYLLKEGKKSFSSVFEFTNPTFFPKEGIVRGVEYGHPGEVPLYKYKWNKLKIDTVEYIYPDITDTNDPRLYKVLNSPFSLNNPAKIRIKSVPKEYHNTEGYNWFMSY